MKYFLIWIPQIWTNTIQLPIAFSLYFLKTLYGQNIVMDKQKINYIQVVSRMYY